MASGGSDGTGGTNGGVYNPDFKEFHGEDRDTGEPLEVNTSKEISPND